MPAVPRKPPVPNCDDRGRCNYLSQTPFNCDAWDQNLLRNGLHCRYVTDTGGCVHAGRKPNGTAGPAPSRAEDPKPVFYPVSPDSPPLGSKFDKGKPRWSLLPWRELEDVVRVLTMGAEKYSVDNWQQVDNATQRYSDALMRHFTAWATGERVDNESGVTHLAHAVCCALFLMWFDNEQKYSAPRIDPEKEKVANEVLERRGVVPSAQERLARKTADEIARETTRKFNRVFSQNPFFTLGKKNKK